MIDVARKHQKLMCKGKEHIKHVETFKEVKGKDTEWISIGYTLDKEMKVRLHEIMKKFLNPILHGLFFTNLFMGI